MQLRKIGAYKDFNINVLPVRIKGLNKALSNNYGKDIAVTSRVLDELYQIILFSLEKKEKAVLLEAAESLKLAYGLAREGKQIRADEYLYWREVVLATLVADEFQAVEYLLEGSKNLLKIFANERPAIVDTMKMIATMAMQKKKFFIASTVIEILLYRLSRFAREDGKATAAIINCFSSIGLNALKNGEKAFFKEICALLCQDITAISQPDEADWEKLITNWLNGCLKQDMQGAFADWQRFFRKYSCLHSGANPAFYSELVKLAAPFVISDEDKKINILLNNILKCIWRRANYLESMLCAQALNKAFQDIASMASWEKTAFVFKPFFLFSFHLACRSEKKDRWTALGESLLEVFIKGINQTAAFVVIKFACADDLHVLYGWRSFFLCESKSESSAQRIKKYWRLSAEQWKMDNPDKVELNKDILAVFYE